jgi:diguanylate cyclase (GGDEF)-like protein/PAS domain S-box-containing protein
LGTEWHKPRLTAVIDQLLTPVVVLTGESTILHVNRTAAHAIGQEPNWLIGRRILEFVHPEDQSRIRGELLQVASGRPFAGLITYRIRNEVAHQWHVFESTATNLLADPDIEGIVVSSRDITEQVEHERRLHEVAYIDPVTGLPNRTSMEGELDGLMGGDTDLAVAFVGIDRFMLIKDTLGPSVGDSALHALATRIRSAFPSTTIVGRFAGNVIALLLTGADAHEAERLLLQCSGRWSEPMFIAGHEFRLSVSVGVAHRHDGATSESLLRDAGLAHSRAKMSGGGRVEVASAEMLESLINRVELESDIRRALDCSEFTLALQPIVRLADGAPVQSEALVRWHTQGVTREPCAFIPIAEETGLILPLGDWILERALELASRHVGGEIMVNLSARQLAAPGLPDRIRRGLLSHGVPATSIGFEVTETLLMENFEFAVDVINEIRGLGCRIGLDDFGTGYSSFGYLRRLPIDFVKIDRSLTAGIETDDRARHIVGAIIDMVSALGHDVVAEGVESEEQATVLTEFGCGFAQGYYFGRPTEIVEPGQA